MQIANSQVARPHAAPVLTRLRRAIVAYLEWRANRKAYLRLASMEDRILKDIGVTRDDLDNVLSKPPWRDAD
ncbi:MAG: DUF1127 domain-containing protein [Pseudomonadota bacterium]